MNYPSIRIEGAILSPDILDRIDDIPGQKAADFGLESSIKVKDEIARAWADAQDYWRIFQRKLEAVKLDSPATSETRQQWVVPLLALLGYQVDHHARGAELNGKLYAISHRATNRAQAPVQIVGYRETAGLDRKPENATLRMSAHAVVQEFINLNEQLYGLVTNGRVLRLLRDSSRLIKLSYLEFDLDRIFTDGIFSDFAILYRLLHATRLPLTNESAAESWIERYHQDSLESGARIRDGLSQAVERAIRDFGTGFLAHPANTELREAVASENLRPDDYYKNLLRLIYRLLFLMVIEERDLVFPPGATTTQREIYRRYYSVHRLRLLSEHRYLADHRRHDLWMALISTFRLFDAGGPGDKLGLASLAGDLFGHQAIPHLAGCTLGNDVLLGCLRSLSVYEHPENRQLIRVNYGALNVEEFGSVYEGLLEYRPVFHNHGNTVEFTFEQGGERAATGSHYTPDDLVQPLVKHSLDYLIADRLKASNPEAALLDLRVADIACGSGHILLAAARRIASELAIVRTGEEQPSPPAFRAALRDVIRTCIYGVDLNPLAVELCKVALWLEAHNPGQPLNFLDHHIKCGNAIVGFVQREELDKGVPNEAFVTMPEDDKDLAASWRKENKQERANSSQIRMVPAMQQRLDGRLAKWNVLSALTEQTPAEIEAKKQQFLAFTQGNEAFLLAQIAAIPIAQFYIPKTPNNDSRLVADAQFRRYWIDGIAPQGEGTAMALATSIEKRFFHWFLEFPDIIARGGFDCILGNPPYLGGTFMSGVYGQPLCHYVKWQFAPTGLSDLVVYFLRRIFALLRPGGFTAFITTNSIRDGDIRQDGLDHLLSEGATINFAVRGIRWPGRANLIVSLVSLHRGRRPDYQCILDGKPVSFISAFFEDYADIGEPSQLRENVERIFAGSQFRGDGFLLTHDEASALRSRDARLAQVIFPVINGQEINNHPELDPGREIINFFDWDLSKADKFGEAFARVERLVKPERDRCSEENLRKKWWLFERARMDLYDRLVELPRAFVTAITTKYLNFSAVPANCVYLNTVDVFTTDRWDLYAVIQSTLHEVWARKYSGALKQDLRYSPSKCFETFAFPDGLWQTPALQLR
jgi:N-6 DNA Methylase